MKHYILPDQYPSDDENATADGDGGGVPPDPTHPKPPAES